MGPWLSTEALRRAQFRHFGIPETGHFGSVLEIGATRNYLVTLPQVPCLDGVAGPEDLSYRVT